MQKIGTYILYDAKLHRIPKIFAKHNFLHKLFHSKENHVSTRSNKGKKVEMEKFP